MNKDWVGNKTAFISTNGFANLTFEDRSKYDFYATEPLALEKLLKYETFTNVWECACGLGHLSEVLKKYNMHGRSSDIIDRGYEGTEIVNFLTYLDDWNGDIITNPPYKYGIEFVYKALEIIPNGNKVAMFFPQRYLSGKSRYKLYMQYPPFLIYALSSRVACAKNGNFNAASNSAVDYMWVIWIKGFKNNTNLKWIL